MGRVSRLLAKSWVHRKGGYHHEHGHEVWHEGAHYELHAHPHRPSVHKGPGGGGAAPSITAEQKAQILAGMDAMKRAIQTQADVPNAMRRDSDGIDAVDFLWGQAGAGAPDFKGGWGIAKEIAKRSYEHGVDPNDPSAARTLMALPMVIALGKAKKLDTTKNEEKDRQRLEYRIKDEMFVVYLVKDEKSTNHWLLSGYEVRAARAKAGPR